MLGTNLRCLDNLNGIWGFDTSNSLQTTSYLFDLFVHLVHNSSSVALQLHGSASQPARGSAICVDNTQKAVEWQVWLIQHLASSGDLLSVPSGGWSMHYCFHS